MARPKKSGKSWFALSCNLDSPEAEVRREIGRAAKVAGLSPRLVGRVLLVRHKEPRTLADGGSVVYRVKSYPGYLIASLAYCDAVQVFLNGVRGVQGLLPLPLRPGDKPTPTALDSIEAAEQLIKVQAAKKDKPNPYAEARKGPVAAGPVESTAKYEYRAGNPVTILAGTFAGFTGRVTKVLNRTDVAVEFSLMGKPTTKVVEEYNLRLEN